MKTLKNRLLSSLALSFFQDLLLQWLRTTEILDQHSQLFLEDDDVNDEPQITADEANNEPEAEDDFDFDEQY